MDESTQGEADDHQYNSYDEDLNTNPFFKALGKNKPVYAAATENLWTICVPCAPSLADIKAFSVDVIKSHLLSTVAGAENEMFTANSKMVRFEGKFIKTLSGFKEPRRIRILFEETFFNSKDQTYRVICLERPLEGGKVSLLDTVKQVNLQSAESCRQYLTEHPVYQKHMKEIAESIFTLKNTYEIIQDSFPDTINACSSIFAKLLTSLLKSNTKKGKKEAEDDKDLLKLALETHLMAELHHPLFEGLSILFAPDDAKFNKIAKGLCDLNEKALGVLPEHAIKIPFATEVISSINSLTTPYEKALCLRRAVNIVTKNFALSPEEDDAQVPISADELIPILMAAIIRSDVPNWLTNMNYITHFHLSDTSNEEVRFSISSFQAAIEYIETELEANNNFSGSDDPADQNGVEPERKISFASFAVRKRTESILAGVNQVLTPRRLFEEVSKGNAEAVTALLLSNSTKKADESLMCHPLCDCAKCQKLLSVSSASAAENISIYSRDSEGCTALHLAARFGQVAVFRILLEAGSLVNACNHEGATSLHIACQRNHPEIIELLLSHSNTDVNLEDVNGNTPMHICAATDNTDCARLFFLKQVQHKANLEIFNLKEETPLHLAAKYGYPDMVELLLKSGASIESRNQKQLTPLELAQNKNVRAVFEKFLDKIPTIRYRDTILTVATRRPAGRGSFSDASDTASSHYPISEAELPADDPQVTEDMEKLFRYIGDGDIAMVRFKLQKPEADTASDDLISQMCHPLCECDKCTEIMEKINSMPQKEQKGTQLKATTRGSGGNTAIHVAASLGQDDIIKLLVDEFGVNVNLRNSVGMTPLHFATENNHLETMQLLLKTFGANANMLTLNTENSPLHLCSTMEAATLLFRYANPTPNPNFFNRRGETPLHLATKKGPLDLVEFLLRNGANPTLRNGADETPDQLAKSSEIAAVLLEAIGKLPPPSSEEPKLGEKPEHSLSPSLSSSGLANSTSSANSLPSYSPLAPTTPAHAAATSTTGLYSAWSSLLSVPSSRNKGFAENTEMELPRSRAPSLSSMMVHHGQDPVTSRKTNQAARFLVNEVFEALEGRDLEQRTRLMESVVSFRQGRLRKIPFASDRSNPQLFALAIPHFQKELKLKKVETREATTPTTFMVLAKTPGEENRVDSDSDMGQVKGSKKIPKAETSQGSDSLGFPRLLSRDESGNLISPGNNVARRRAPAPAVEDPEVKEQFDVRRFSLFSE